MKETTQLVKVHTFSGVQDSDVDPRYAKDTDFVDSENLRFGVNSQTGVATLMKGTQQIETPFIEGGTNARIVTMYEDKTFGHLYLFVSDGAFDPKILRLQRTVLAGAFEVILIAKFADFNFLYQSAIEVFKVGNLLYWNNSRWDGNQFIGSEPMMLDVDKCVGIGVTAGLGVGYKIPTYEFYIPLTIQQLNASETYLFNLTEIDGTFLSTVSVTVSGTRAAKYKALTTFLNANLFPTINKGDYLIVESGAFNVRLAENNTSNQLCINPLNHYPATLSKEYLGWAKRPPLVAPDVRYVIGYHDSPGWSPAVTRQNYTLGNDAYQFMYRYRYFDNSLSAWSEPSGVAYRGAYSIEGYSEYTHTEIVVKLPDLLLKDRNVRWAVRTIEVAFRQSNIGIWKSLGEKHISFYGTDVAGPNSPAVPLNEQYKGIHMVFVTDSYVNIVESDDRGAADIQVIKAHTNLPRIISTCCSHTDDEGNTIAFIGGGVEGYDQPSVVGRIESRQFENVYNPLYNSSRQLLKSYKSGGKYKFALQYEDGYGRKTPAIYIATHNQPTLQAGYSIQIFKLIIETKAPSWATRYRVLHTKNLNQSSWCVFLSADWRGFLPTDPYVGWNGLFKAVMNKHTGKINAAPVAANIITAGVSENVLFFPIMKQSRDKQDARKYVNGKYVPINDTESVADVYLWQNEQEQLSDISPRSRIRVLAIGDHSSLVPYASFLDLEVIGWWEDANLNMPLCAITSIPPSYPNTNKSVVFEIYTPIQQGTDVYYESGLSFPIVNQNHGGTISQAPGVPEAVVDLYETGDAYWRTFYNVSSITEAAITTNAGNTIIEKSQVYENIYGAHDQMCIGRVNYEDPKAKMVQSRNKIRHSRPYIDNGQVNGLGDFGAFDVYYTRIDSGVINKLIMCNDVLVAISQYASNTFYVSKDKTLQLNGDGLFSSSSNVLNMANLPVRSWGTHHKESVVFYDGNVYAWDGYNKVMWRYGQSGFEDIGKRGRRMFWQDHYGESPSTPAMRINKYIARAGIEPEFKNYIIQFNKDGRYENADPIYFVYNIEKDAWQGTIRHKSDSWGMLGNNSFSANRGILHLNNVGNACEIYGEVVLPSISFNTSSADPFEKVTPKSIEIYSQMDWEVLISAIFSETYIYQASKIPALTLIEGVRYGDFKRDENDPATEFEAYEEAEERVIAARNRGRELRNHAFVVTLRCKAAWFPTVLFGVKINSVKSS